MSLIKVSGKYVVTVCGKHLAAYSIGSQEVIQCSVPGLNDAASKSGDKDSNSSIIAAEFDLSEEFFAACTDCKRLMIWTVEGDWKLYSTRSLPRRPTALAFTKCGNFVVIGDKAGDVHRFPVSLNSELSESEIVNSSLLLGHVSMLLDVKLCAGDRFIVTCDRDEKIRVSCYPNAYSVHNYCLGHTEYVTRLCYFADDDLLASASGDGTVKLWNYQCGEILDDVDCSMLIDYSNTVSSDSHHRSTDIRCMTSTHRLLAVSFNGCCDLLLFSIVASDSSSWKLVFQHHLTLSAAIWDMAFLTQRHLLVLQDSENPAVVVCTLSVAEGSNISITSATDDDDVSSLVARMNSNTQLFRSAADVPSIFPVLHKARRDNMKEYVQKKRLRLAEKQKGQKDDIQSTVDDCVVAKRHKVAENKDN